MTRIWSSSSDYINLYGNLCKRHFLTSPCSMDHALGFSAIRNAAFLASSLNLRPSPVDYPWSNYRYNTLGQPDEVVTPQQEYSRLSKTDAQWQSAYRQMFETQLAGKTLDEIRSATNMAWVLGSDQFKARIARQLEQRVSPTPKGGNRKSEDYRRKAISHNQLSPTPRAF
jgi:hypothetical protein